MDAESKFQISYTREGAVFVVQLLVGCAALLTLLYGIMNIAAPDVRWGPLRPLFDLDGDLSIPAWFSAIQLFAVGLVLLLAAREHDRLRFFLFSLGLVFIFLSADEAAAVHERVTIYAKRLNIAWLPVFKGDHGAWILPYLLLGLAFVLISYRPILLLWHHFRREAMFIGAGAAVFGLGAVGFEIFSYLFLRGEAAALYLMEVAAEEFFEMSGVSLVLYGVMLLALRLQSRNRIRDDGTHLLSVPPLPAQQERPVPRPERGVPWRKTSAKH